MFLLVSVPTFLARCVWYCYGRLSRLVNVPDGTDIQHLNVVPNSTALLGWVGVSLSDKTFAGEIAFLMWIPQLPELPGAGPVLPDGPHLLLHVLDLAIQAPPRRPRPGHPSVRPSEYSSVHLSNHPSALAFVNPTALSPFICIHTCTFIKISFLLPICLSLHPNTHCLAALD